MSERKGIKGKEPYSSVFISRQNNDIEVGNPVLELASPIGERTLRNNDQVVTVHFQSMFEIAEERYCLQSLAETLYKGLLSLAPVRNTRKNPRTISSARIPLSPLWWSETIQFKPWS